MPPSPIIFQIGSLTLRWYGVFIVLAAVVASWVAASEARRRGEDPDHVWQALPLVLVAGIIGARTGFVLVSLANFQNDWLRVFYVWEGGLSIQGGLIGGILAMMIYVSRAHLRFLRWADIGIVGVPLGQAIGRWGNYFNQEAYGEPCSQPWCIPISPDRRPAALGLKAPDGTPFAADYGAGTNFHFAPTFAYEMLWDLGTFLLLFWLGRTRRFGLREGDLLWTYGIAYSVGRFVIEGIRLDSASGGGQRIPQVFALLTILVCLAAYVYRHRPGSAAPLASGQQAGAVEGPDEAEPAGDGAWADETDGQDEAPAAGAAVWGDEAADDPDADWDTDEAGAAEAAPEDDTEAQPRPGGAGAPAVG